MNMQVIGTQSSLLLPLTKQQFIELRYLEDKPKQIILPLNLSFVGGYSHLQEIQHLESLIQLIAGFKNTYKKGIQAIFDFIEALSKLTNLEDLNLSFDWSLGHEGAKFIGKSLEQLVNLKKLNLNIMAENRIGQEGAKFISEGLLHLINLNYLELKLDSDNKIGAEGLTSISYSIGNLKNLTKLILHIGNNNNLYAKGFSAFGNQLIQLKNLQDLSLYFGVGNVIGDEGLSYLSRGLQQLTQLNKFSIDIYHGNQIGILGISTFFSALQHLKMLKIVQINLRDNIDLEMMENISNSLKELKQITSLSFQLKLEEQQSRKSLTKLLQGIKHLNELNTLYIMILSYSFQNDKDKNHIIFDSLQSLTNLKVFEIEICSNNDINNTRMINLAENISYLKNLEELSFILGEPNSILKETAIELGNSLKQLNMLTSLKIIIQKGLKIQIEGMEGIMEGVQTLTNLCFLTIEIGKGHEIRDQGAISLNQCLQNLPNLKEFVLKIGELNRLTTNSLNQIVEGITSLQKLEKLDVDIAEMNSIILIDILNLLQERSVFKEFKLNGKTVKYEEKSHYVQRYEDEKIENNLEIWIDDKSRLDTKGVQFLIKSLSKMTNLNLLKFQIDNKSFLNDISLNEFAKQLICLQNIQKLVIIVKQNEAYFGLEGLKLLSDSFKKLTNLTELQLQSHFFGGWDGSDQLANGLKHLVNLKKLVYNIMFIQYHKTFSQVNLKATQSQIDILDNFEKLETYEFNFQEFKFSDNHLNFEKFGLLNKLKHLTVNQVSIVERDLNLMDFAKNIKQIQNLEMLSIQLSVSFFTENIYYLYESIISLANLRFLKIQKPNFQKVLDGKARNMLMRNAKHLVKFVY